MIYGSVSSGIEAASVAWGPLGWKAAFFSEIDKACCRLLAAKYPDVPNYGDMTRYEEWPTHAIDLLCGGTPCQSFSVAGLGKGLADPRGNLMLTYLAIAQKYRPRWLVWENVPGVLSSNGGRDFGTFVGGLAELGYGFAYRILDAQYIRVESHPRAVPQRRRRVVLVGYIGDWRRAAAVLFERESLCGHTAPRREARQETARGLEIGPGGDRFADVNPALDAGAWDGPVRNQLPEVSLCLNAGAMGRLDSESETLICSSAQNQSGEVRGGGVANTINTNSNSSGDSMPMVPSAVVYCTRSGMAPHGSMRGDVVSPALRAKETEPPLVTRPINMQVATRHNAMGERTALGIGSEADPAFTLQAAHSHAVAIQGTARRKDPESMEVRRLTPLECERLQGFPDGYTDVPAAGKSTTPDGPRYRQLGNSWPINVMRWVGERIDMVDAIPVVAW